ncbi:MAG: lamin tail domain-containing protein, partial [Limisphaerales bacterium]
APWPVVADGVGHSLVLARPSYGENDPQAWAPSALMGGSPGTLDPMVPGPLRGVVINEFLAHTDEPQLDFVELYNPSNAAVDVSGCVLTDDPSTNRFRLPTGTVIAARGFLAFDQNQMGFRLDAAGETIYLIHPERLYVVDAIQFGAQENGVASGRSPDGSTTLRRLSQPTAGAANAPWRTESVVINELMYHPISGDDNDEYVELHNRAGALVDLGGWRFTQGIGYTFPPGSAIAAGGYLVVAKNAARLRANHPQLTAANAVGDYSGSLANSGERVALAKPDTIVSTNTAGEVKTNRIDIVVSEVAYGDGGRWGQWADGGGSSLELIDPDADLLRPGNWADSDETQKAPWTPVEFTGRLDNGSVTANRLRIGMLGAGECLVDDVELFRAGSTNVVRNPGFEGGTTSWSFFGNHSRSTVDTTGAASGTSCLHVRAGGDGDTGINSIRTPLFTSLPANSTATIRAKVRWVTGWPEVLFRLQGNWLELPARMTVPKNLGTPGLPNSRRVNNAGPAIYEVTHQPALPRANETVVVRCRVSDPDGVASVQLRYRRDPNASLTTVMMRDDGLNGDEIAGDGRFSGRIPGQGGGTLVGFRIVAQDDASTAASATFPPLAPQQECLVRWGDPIPTGTFAHYHLWSTQATENARSTGGLDNTWRDATLVYGDFRVIYNVGFRDKGSPWHGGTGDIAATLPPDDLLLGATDRIFASTGNGGSEGTAIRSQLASWFGQRMGIPYLHAHYLQLYRNGGQFREVMEDLEQPNHGYAERWTAAAEEGDLYKVAMWFEFPDDNYNFNGGGSVNGATIERFLSGGAYKMARYRWHYQRRSNDGNASNFTNLFDLVTAVNDTSTAYVDKVLNLADVPQWMRVWAFDFAMGNWDAWSYNVGQNMYLYKPAGRRWMLLPWDIDFTFGLGDGTSAKLWEGQDPVINRMYGNPAFQRMIWQAYLDVVNGPFLAANFQPQIDARRSALLKNNVSGLQSPTGITSWISGRRNYILGRINSANASAFAITTNSGNDFDSATPAATIEGTAPFAVATIEVNGVPYPVTWTTVQRFRISVPLPLVTNTLVLSGRDPHGNVVAGAADTV